MSIKVMGWVWDFSPQVGNRLLMLLAMADHAADDGGNIFPSIKRLAHKVRVQERQAQYLIAELEKDGALIREVQGGGRGRTARWRIPMDEKVQAHAPFAERVQSEPEKVQSGVVKGAKAIAPDPSGSVRRDPSERKVCLIPKDFMLSDGDIAFAKRHGIEGMQRWMPELERFMLHHQGKGTKMRDWHAAWRTWVLNQEKWAREREAKQPSAASDYDYRRIMPTPEERAARNGHAS